MIDEDYLKLLVEETPDALIATTPEGRVLYWSRGAERTFGYTAEEIIGRPLDELVVPPGRMEEQHAVWRELRHTGRAVYEAVRHRKDGALIYINIATHAVQDAEGKVKWYVTNKRDITQQKALRDAKLVEARYGNLLESTPDAIMITNETGRIVLVNVETEKLFGYQRNELVGAPMGLLVPDRFGDKHSGERATYFADSRVRPMDAGLDLYGVRRDGTEFPVEIKSNPIKTEEGRLVTSSIRDITERKRFERSLQNANRTKSEFLASMSHELRTPLNGIIGFTEFLMDEKPGALNAKQKEYLTDVYNSSQHLLQLINDVLDLAKVEAGRIDLRPETFGLGQAICEVCAVINGIARKRRVEVSYKVPVEIGEVTLDQQKFKQVCYNLLANAVKFTDPGGKVELGARLVPGEQFEIWVRDTGIGIKEEDMERLFREFEQLETGTARRFEGSGLGLALVKKLVEYQGGSIGVQSQFGRGSTFTVTLPLTWKKGERHE